MCLVLTGEDARAFEEYMKDPTDTPEGLSLIYEAALIAFPNCDVMWIQKRIDYLKPLCEENIVRKRSEFTKMFQEAGL
jgi:hypothetical protein